MWKPVTTKRSPAVNIQAPTATKKTSTATMQAPATTKQINAAAMWKGNSVHVNNNNVNMATVDSKL
ncbi:hypothetical protein DSO57_1033136 [Entomophthora muscae]|uniref:Uncharacterized protein n=1 Tax=Entomophthora muscae TaxID=34485 RepID=A0ACC2S2B0_9FUNG|nr:hypothetical protein DSO57_1033136 [Entomophthora muscae]